MTFDRKAYREANKDKIAERKKAYCEAKRERERFLAFVVFLLKNSSGKITINNRGINGKKAYLDTR